MHATDGGRNGSRLEDRLRLIIVAAPDVAAPLLAALDVADLGAWMWVENERALYFSARVLDLIGLDAEPRATLLTRFLQSVHADDQEAVRNLLLGSAPGGPFKLRYRFTPPDGPLRWIEDRGRVERDASGVLVRQGGILRDVTHDVGRELERREADARLEALVNAMPFAVWGRGGASLQVTHQNAESIAVWGDLRGQTPSDAPLDVRTIWEQQLAEAMTGAVVRGRREFAREGEVFAFDEIIAPVVVEDHIAGVVGVAIDVTEEARAARFQALLAEIAADFAGRTTASLDAGVAAALEKIARFIGAPVAVLCELDSSAREDRLRITHWWLDPNTGRQHPRQFEIDVTQIRSLLQQAELNSPVVIRSRADVAEGSTERAWLEANAVQSFAIVPTRQLDGRRTLLGLAGASDVIVDWPGDTVPCLRLAAALLGGVLARGRADADQRALERRMQDAQRLESLGVLAGGIAHDFNNLLTTILGNASLLRAGLGTVEGVSDGIEEIEAASRRAAELCRQMLAYAGRGRFALQLIDLNALLNDMRSVLEVTVPRSVDLTLQLAASLPSVLADESQLRQLIMSLVFNAIEALDEHVGSVSLSTGVGHRTSEELAGTVFSPHLPDGTYVSIKIRDTGVGMSPETAARIFDPFFSTKFTGRGLGLSAAVGIVRAHQGALRVQSALGAGSTFELILPAQTDRVGLPIPPVSPTSHASMLSWRTTGTALVVDDERGVRDLARTVLERVGMTVVVAENGRQAIDELARLGDAFRVVFVDLTMPEMDGRQTLAAIRRLRPGVPAVLMSGYSPTDLLNSSSYVFLQKPFTPGMLRAAAKRALDE